MFAVPQDHILKVREKFFSSAHFCRTQSEGIHGGRRVLILASDITPIFTSHLKCYEWDFTTISHLYNVLRFIFVLVQ